jgi:hypothetical protein
MSLNTSANLGVYFVSASFYSIIFKIFYFEIVNLLLINDFVFEKI